MRVLSVTDGDGNRADTATETIISDAFAMASLIPCQHHSYAGRTTTTPKLDWSTVMPVSLAKTSTISLRKTNADGSHKTDTQRRAPGIDMSKRGR